MELGSEAEAARAVEGLNGKEILGRWVTVRFVLLYGYVCIYMYMYTSMCIAPAGAVLYVGGGDPTQYIPIT